MGASPIVRRVYADHLEHFGEPDQSITFDDADAPPGRPARIDIFVWHASADTDITTFSTIGMAAAPMVGAEHRAVLHFSVRRALTPGAVRGAAKFLANLAVHPFLNAEPFDWWHKVRDPGPVPLVAEATAVLFHPKFAAAGWDTIDADGNVVKFLNVVPITPEEYEMWPQSRLQRHWSQIGIDLFEPR